MGGGSATAGGSAGGGSTGGGTATAGGMGGGSGMAGGMGGGSGTAGGNIPDAGPSVCRNGTREGAELCDDGNMVDTDNCKNDCTFGAAAPYCGDGTMGGTEACDDGNVISGDGCEADCTASVAAPSTTTCGDGVRQGQEECDDASGMCAPDCTLKSPLIITCPAATATINTPGSCDAVPGDNGRLVVGTVLLPGKVYRGGQVLIDGANGNITCVGCDCSATTGFATATKLLCGTNVVSPGLINSHDHITYTGAPFYAGWTDAGFFADGGIPERYEHRHDWRVGGAAHDGHTVVSNGGTGNANAITWQELRQLVAGTTSVAGSGGARGLLRNIDDPDTSATASNQQGLGANTLGALYDTFPLRDSSGAELTEGCAYPTVPNASVVPSMAAYLPHISEGIERSARNEFLCVSGVLTGVAGIYTPRTAMIHGIALKPPDVRFIADKGSSLIWSPRSNVSLYGETANVSVYHRSRANIALGSDWVRSGSMNIVRELQCADYLSSSFYGGFFSDESLWRMPTINAAKALVVSTRTGVLERGRTGDISVYRYTGTGNPYRAVITARPEDTLLVLRGGTPMFGDEPVIATMSSMCNGVTVCGASKSVCLSEIGTTYIALANANSTAYPLAFCGGPPPTEPVCTPMRGARWLFSGANAYTGLMTPGTDSDGDGIADATDNCPQYFNPIRPEDNGVQADADGDGRGDVCDVCPMSAGAPPCAAYDPADSDGDGVANLSDKCPMDRDPMQVDTDGDNKGDVCDSCPMQSNPGNTACPPPPGMLATIIQIKSGVITPGTRVQIVNVLVTGTGSGGVFVQDETAMSPDNTGLFIYYPASPPRTDILVGDRITIPAGTVQNFNGQIQVASVPNGSIAVLTHGNMLPAPVLVTPADVTSGGPRATVLEGVFVRLENVFVADAGPTPDPSDTPPTNEFTVQKLPMAAELRVNDYLYQTTPHPQAGEQLGFIQGILEFRNGSSKLEPRGDFDLQRPVQLLSIGPAGQFTREGMAATGPTFPLPLKVRINSVQTTDTFVTLVSDAGISVPPTVTVLAGQIEAAVPVQGLVPSPAEFITATLDGGSFVSTTVRVIGNAEVPQLLACTPNPLTLPEDGIADLTVTTDIPVATASGLGLDGGSFVSVAAPVTFAANTRTVTFQVLASPGSTGPGSLEATLGASTLTCPINISNLPVTNHVVISEIKVAGSAGANDEFVELYNPTATEVDISGWRVQYKAAAATSMTYQNKAQLPPGSRIAPKGYFLVVSGGAGGYSDPVMADTVYLSSAGAPTAFQFSGTAGHVRIGPNGIGTSPTDPSAVDTVGYGVGVSAPEGGNPAPAPTTSGTIERKANANSTSASMAVGGPDALFGNGLDTDNNGDDWVTRAAPQPQSRASGTIEP